MGNSIKLAMVTFAMLVLFTPLASAQWQVDASGSTTTVTSETADIEHRCRGWECISHDSMKEMTYPEARRLTGRRWTEAKFFELGLVTQYQFALAKPEVTGFSGALSHSVDAKFCWSYISPQGVTGIFGPNLRMGHYFAHSYDKVAQEGITAHSFTLQPGFYHANYVDDDRWLISQALSLPLVMMEPGIQLDVAVSYIASDIFSFEFGVAMGYYQTNLDLSNGEEVDWFSLGPHLGFIFEPWGDYK